MALTRRYAQTAAAIALTAGIGFGASTVTAQDAAPAAAEPAAEAASEPTAKPAAPAEAAPETAPAPAAETAASEPAPATSKTAAITADDLVIGTPVLGSDGEKIGEVNRVTTGAGGAVTEIQVTTGGPAKLGAEAVAITPDKITSTGEAIKLSLTAADVKSYPPVRPDAG